MKMNFLKFVKDIQIKNLSCLILVKGRPPSHYENVFKDIKALLFYKNIEETVPSPSQGIDSEFDRNEENYDNEKFAIMAKFKAFFDVYRDTFFSHVEN